MKVTRVYADERGDIHFDEVIDDRFVTPFPLRPRVSEFLDLAGLR